MDFITFFAGLFGDKWLAQWIGVLAMAVAFIGYRRRDAKQVFAFQIVTNLIWAVHLFMLGAYTASILNILGFIRSVFLYADDKPWGRSKVSMWIIAAAMAMSCPLTWEGWYSVMPTIAMVLGTILLWKRDDRLVRITQIALISPLWLVHNYLAGSVAGVLTECLNIISVALTMAAVKRDAKKAG